MPFGFGKKLLAEVPGTINSPPPPPPPPGTGGNNGQPDFLNLAAEWRADKIKTRPVSATLGTNPAHKFAVTSMINQIPGSPDLIVPPGYDSPILLTNTNGLPYAVGECDTNFNDVFVQTHQTGGGGFLGNVNYWGGTPSLVSATPINKLRGSAFTLYILASNTSNSSFSIVNGLPSQNGSSGTWNLKGATQFQVRDAGFDTFTGNSFRGISYSDPNDPTQANGNCDYFEHGAIWLSAVVCDVERASTGPVGGGESQLLLFTDSDYLTGPANVPVSNTTFDGANHNQGPINSISNSTFSLWVPDITQPVQTAYTIDPAAFSFFAGLPNSAFISLSDFQWINTGNKYYYVTHIMLYNDAHTFAQRQQVRAYINNIWGHIDVHVTTLDSTSTPGG